MMEKGREEWRVNGGWKREEHLRAVKMSDVYDSAQGQERHADRRRGDDVKLRLEAVLRCLST